jgi:tRNA nucleotidyltransferase (CCA-adding enzyme)
VFVVDNAEIAFARTERKIGTGYKGFEIIATPTINIEEDLLRRDLTINAMAVDIITEALIDPWGGSQDITGRTLWPTSPAFLEDPVRALRVARFAAEFDFDVCKTIHMYINRLTKELYTINNDMKFKELSRALVGKAPWRFIEVLRDSGALKHTFPELHALDGVDQPKHNDGDALQHTLTALKTCRGLTNDLAILLAVLYHDVGKGNTPEDILPHHSGHELRSCDIIESLTWMPNEYKKYAKAVARDHMRAHEYSKMNRGPKVKMLLRVNNSSRGIDGFAIAVISDRPTAETQRDINQMREDLKKILTVSGKDVPEGTPAGEAFGLKLHELRCKALQRRIACTSKI